MSGHKVMSEAAKAAGTTVEEFAKRVRGILGRKKCRDTNDRVFTADVLKAIR